MKQKNVYKNIQLLIDKTTPKKLQLQLGISVKDRSLDIILDDNGFHIYYENFERGGG